MNPAPVTGHVQGSADIYGITISTTDGINAIDTASPKVAPVEAVFVSGTVDESLSFVVTGLNTATSHCGTTTVTSTATTIPWNHFAATNTFYLAAQNLVVSTNAGSGYAVTIQANDQMGRNGNACPGVAPSTGDYTFTGSIYCIRDTVCQASACSSTAAKDWTVASGFGGLGYSEASVVGTIVAPFFNNELNRTWSAKELPDMHDSGVAQTVMSSTVPVSGDSVDICYRIAIPGTQPSGYYYNTVKYTATATF